MFKHVHLFKFHSVFCGNHSSLRTLHIPTNKLTIIIEWEPHPQPRPNPADSSSMCTRAWRVFKYLARVCLTGECSSHHTVREKSAGKHCLLLGPP